MAKLFGTNGIRGVFPNDLTLEFVHDITLSLATYFVKGPILVGYDGRESSQIICKIVCAALNYAGLDCNIAGLVPTPCLEYATKKLGYSGGIMITASHNPPQYNGIKPVANDGVEISREDELTVEDIYFTKKWKPGYTWGHTGKEDRAIEIYINGIIDQVNVTKIVAKNFTIALDLGNGAQAVAAPILANKLGCHTILINDKIDGKFPGRGSEPTPQNLQYLSNAVQKNQADLGIAFDGDGDRSIFCDDVGNVLTGDKSALILSQYILQNNPNSTIVTCLNSGSSIEDIATESNSKVIRTKVGSVEVSREMIPSNALIGFEENGGFMYGKHNQVRDGCMALALMLDVIANTGKTLSEIQLDLPPSFTTKDKLACSLDDAKKLIVTLKSEYPDAETTDGIKISINSKNWVMIRPSGTEPIIRIYVEADSKEKLDSLLSKYLEKAKAVLSR